jgi:rod shape-determining protein MreC
MTAKFKSGLTAGNSMDTFLGRYRNLLVLAAILFAQIIGLAIQVRRPSHEGETRLIRLWAVSAVTPIESTVIHSQRWLKKLWTTYIYLYGVRRENRELRAEIGQMKIEEARLSEDARMAQRIQALLAFKEQYIDSTVAAQVIGTSGSDQSRVLYIDKGANDGLTADMAVITPSGIVGKIAQVFPDSSQVLPINDQFSGVGAALKDSRLQGIVKGAANGAITLQYIMSDEKVVPGEEVITSGGDRIFPKGLPVGKVVSVEPGKDLFLNIRVVPSARLDQLEEVLVVTKITEKMPDAKDLGPLRASDILAERLPSVPNKTEVDAAGNAKPASAAAAGTTPAATGTGTAAGTAVHPATAGTGANKPGVGGTAIPNKPAGAVAAPHAGAPGATPETNGTVKPKATTPANGRAAGTAAKPSNNAAPAASMPGESGAQNNGEASPPAKKQVKPTPESTPNVPSERPSTPPAGASPQP